MLQRLLLLLSYQLSRMAIVLRCSKQHCTAQISMVVRRVQWGKPERKTEFQNTHTPAWCHGGCVKVEARPPTLLCCVTISFGFLRLGGWFILRGLGGMLEGSSKMHTHTAPTQINQQMYIHLSCPQICALSTPRRLSSLPPRHTWGVLEASPPHAAHELESQPPRPRRGERELV
jgi:hypothetical protein